VPHAENSFYVWVISDVQPYTVDRARQVLKDATDDILRLNIPLTAVWCLGDALRGADLELLDIGTSVFLSELQRCEAPVCYVLGNHDMDYRREIHKCHFPLWEAARNEPSWHLQDKLEDFYFLRRFGKWLVVFMGDHADPGGRWYSTHGHVRGEEFYPHDLAAYAELSRQLGEYDGPVMIASHYAFPGGQKPSALQAQLLPLPANVRALLHGHAHIGDLKWNKDDPWERVHAVTGHAFGQYNISALEPDRSPGSHSALVEFASSGVVSLRIRCHETREWIGRFEI
jgi:calcineurin-like phosphoesterase family protein